MNLSLYLWQRGTAALMAPMVLVHLVVIFYASRHGLSAADILGRVRGSVGWGGFYAPCRHRRPQRARRMVAAHRA
jgi:fumarate reductase subunit C